MKFLLIISSINWIIIWFMPKRITKSEIYCTWGIITLIALFVDLNLGGIKELYNYGIPGPDTKGMLLHFIHEPAFAIIFLNYMPKKTKHFLFYIIAWTLFSVGYEWITVTIHFLKYTGWKLWYSTIVYIIVFLFLRFHLGLFRKFNNV